MPRSLGPRQVADLYRVRREIELNNKLDKSSHRFDEIDARKPAAVHALVHATLIGSMLVSLIVHRYNLAIAQMCTETRTEPPLHHGIVARMLATCAFRIAVALELQGANSDAEWERLASVIVHTGKDPNWRRNPSIIDQLRRWKPISPSPTARSRMRSTA